MKKVYIASPYTKGDVAQNVKESLRLADYLSSNGKLHVKAPLLTHFWHMMFARPYEFWLKYDLIELAECDVLIRMAGESTGADKEVDYANEHMIPCYYFKGFDLQSLNELDKFINNL